MSCFGSSRRSTSVRLVFSSVAILFLEMFFYFMASASCHATTSLIAYACGFLEDAFLTIVVIGYQSELHVVSPGN